MTLNHEAADDTQPTWPDADIPPNWRRESERVIVLQVSGKDRGSSFTETLKVERADFLYAGKTRKDRFLWLEEQQRSTVRSVERTLKRIAAQEPLTLDRAMAGRVLFEFEQYATLTQNVKVLLYERISLLLAQTRGEFNLCYPDKPIEDVNPYEPQEEEKPAEAEGVLT